jgi:hypothetical protein
MRPFRRFLLFPIVLLLATSLRAQNLDAPARDLAARILAVMTPREASRVTVENRSTLAAAEVATAQRALQAELGRQGLQSAPGGAEIRITLSENRSGYLWVAEIRRGEERQVVMTELPRLPAQAGMPLASLTIERELLWEQEEPILDAIVLGPRRLLVLSPTRVAVIQDADRTFWMLPALPQSRDPRGRLALEGDRYRAYLPGAVCTGTWRPALAGECLPATEPWPIQTAGGTPLQASFAASRNYFDGRVALSASGVKTLPPFYSAAVVPEGAASLWIFAALDGRVELYDASLEPAGLFGIAGSDLTSVESACGAHKQVLVTKRSNETESDAVQGYEVAGRVAVAVSEPLEFPGPVTALWAAPDGRTAVAVSRHLKTNRYAAFRLSVTCGR